MLRTWNTNNKTIKQRKADLRTSDQSERKPTKSTKEAMNKKLSMTEAMTTETKKSVLKQFHKVKKMQIMKRTVKTNEVLRMRTQMKQKPNRPEQYFLTE